jgi:hypothetical protein
VPEGCIVQAASNPAAANIGSQKCLRFIAISSKGKIRS